MIFFKNHNPYSLENPTTTRPGDSEIFSKKKVNILEDPEISEIYFGAGPTGRAS